MLVAAAACAGCSSVPALPSEFDCPLLYPRAVDAVRRHAAMMFGSHIGSIKPEVLRLHALWLVGQPGDVVVEARFVPAPGGGERLPPDVILHVVLDGSGVVRRLSLDVRLEWRSIRREESRLDEANTEGLRSPPFLAGRGSMSAALRELQDGRLEAADRAARLAARRLAGRFHGGHRWANDEEIEVDLVGIEGGPKVARLWIPGLRVRQPATVGPPPDGGRR